MRQILVSNPSLDGCDVPTPTASDAPRAIYFDIVQAEVVVLESCVEPIESNRDKNNINDNTGIDNERHKTHFETKYSKCK